MTLILTCLTNDYIVQAADRRLTQPDGTLTSDDANKAVFWCFRAAVAYTGPAKIEGEPTAEWIGKCMAEANVPGIERTMKYIAERAEKYFRDNKDKTRKFAVVAAGWAKVPDELRPYIYVASNFMTDAWTWKASPSDRMSLNWKVMPKASTHMIFAVGQTLATPEDGRLRAGVNRAVARGAPPTVVAKLLGDTIQSVAAGNDFRAKRVGKALIIHLVPRKAVESNSSFLLYGLTPDAHSFHYISPDGRSDQFKGAVIACRGQLIPHFEGGALPRR